MVAICFSGAGEAQAHGALPAAEIGHLILGQNGRILDLHEHRS